MQKRGQMEKTCAVCAYWLFDQRNPTQGECCLPLEEAPSSCLATDSCEYWEGVTNESPSSRICDTCHYWEAQDSWGPCHLHGWLTFGDDGCPDWKIWSDEPLLILAEDSEEGEFAGMASVDEQFSSEDLASIQAGFAELRNGEVWHEHPVQLYEVLRAIWDPDYSPIAYWAPAADWYIGITDQFRKDIQKIDRKLQGRILQAISLIAKEPVTSKGNTIRPLTSDLKGCWRYRIGDYRIIYSPDAKDRLVTLIAFSSRGEAYRS